MPARTPRARPRGFTLIELLVVMAIIGILSSILVPMVGRSRREAHKVQCTANLKNIFTFAMLYADQKDRAYPIASVESPRAHLSIQRLIDAFPRDLEPELFVCPESDAYPAAMDVEGRFVVDADTSSYAWTGRRLKSTTRRRALASDRYVDGYEDDDGAHSGHEFGMNVATTDGSVHFWSTERLDDRTGLPHGLVR